MRASLAGDSDVDAIADQKNIGKSCMPWYTDITRLEAEAELCRAEGQVWTDPWVRIMCDFGADGIWDRDGAPGAISELPITLALMQRIFRWQEDYEEFGKDSPPDPFNWTADELQGFAAEGLEIAIEVKRQLPAWTVLYHDESRIPARPGRTELAALGGPQQGASDRYHDLYRQRFEYEITDAIVSSGKPPETAWPGSA
jgi:hypothetical protein